MPKLIDRQRAKKLVEDGWDIKTVAREMGCSANRLYDLRAAGWPEPQNRRINRYRVAELTKLGWSAAAIARDQHSSERQITRIRSSLKLSQPVPENAGKPLSPERLEAMRLLVEDGASVGEIMRTLKCSDDTVKKYFPDAARDQSEWAHLWGSIRNKPKMRRLFDEMGGIA